MISAGHPRHEFGYCAHGRRRAKKHNHVMAQDDLAIYLVQGGHVQSGYEAAVKLMPGGLPGNDGGAEFRKAV